MQYKIVETKNLKLKVLVSAYACEPGKGSEAEVGWQWVRQIARFHETWVITKTNNRPLIEMGLRNDPNPNLRFVYTDLPSWARFWKKGRQGVHLYYYLWQVLVYRKSREILRYHHCDLVQHITFVNMYMGPWLAMMKVPFVWGPIGANPYIPKQYYSLIGFYGTVDNLLRYGIRMISPYIDPMIQVALNRAKRILTINEEVKARLESKIRIKSVTMSQNAIDEKLISEKPKNFHHPVKILSVGQLVSIKGYNLALAAFAKHISLHTESHLEILGDGPRQYELMQIVAKLGVSNRVTFTGKVDRMTVLQAMADSDVFLFPSFEGAGMVVLEAMAKGLPVVCLDFGGPGEYVTEKCGIKVPLTEPAAVIQGVADALSRLASDPELYERLSAGAITRVREHYLWDQIGDRLNVLYQEVLTETGMN